MLDELWARLIESLARTLPTPVLDNWIRPCRLLAVEGDHLRIGAPNKFSRDWLARNYLEGLTAEAGIDFITSRSWKIEPTTRFEKLFERSTSTTTVLESILQRDRSVDHWGINE